MVRRVWGCARVVRRVWGCSGVVGGVWGRVMGRGRGMWGGVWVGKLISFGCVARGRCRVARRCSRVARGGDWLARGRCVSCYRGSRRRGLLGGDGLGRGNVLRSGWVLRGGRFEEDTSLRRVEWSSGCSLLHSVDVLEGGGGGEGGGDLESWDGHQDCSRLFLS